MWLQVFLNITDKTGLEVEPLPAVELHIPTGKLVKCQFSFWADISEFCGTIQYL